MDIKFFENKRTASPTVRLTFENEKEFELLCIVIDAKTEQLKEERNIHTKEVLRRLQSKKRLYTDKEGNEKPETYINVEDFFNLSLSFLELVEF